ncbi:NACHT and WD repeat domain-containing protein [Streptomyces sp. WAC06614]|uniref:NACHT and WD repeat domain-containing protein n=1 Tax=Streptomyces sp. WAC06614 TaxID=2487416 RepID=UPI000F7AD1B1|nr:NACHT and WD repeat domain-containing protein [Streptomyces sp. WAC06614]RSS61147.1 hypothetical protein EF918_32050 [Streptomyces sp. WAC06614]
MSSTGQDEPEDAAEPAPSQRAAASGEARIYQAAGDMVVAEAGDVHLHYLDGVRETRRASVDAAADCPYPGLEPFETGDARWFFGRDDLVAQTLAELDRAADGPVVIVAPSGAGKSSLLRAGVLPALAAGRLPGSADWCRLLLTPTERPVEQLTALLEQVAGEAGGKVRRHDAAGAGPAPEALTAFLRTAPRTPRLLLVVDQLEELFTLCADEPQRHAFLELLAALSAGPDPVARVVCALRSDFYSRCVTYPRLRSALQHRQIVVGPLTEEGLREVILFPARAAGLALEPGLADLMLADLGGPGPETGRLPLLAHALRATWQQRQGDTLTVAGYRTTGGIGRAVATSAERIYAGLDPAGRTAARAMFLRLVRIGDSADGTDDTRRRLARSDLPAGLVDVFTRGRLLTVEHDDVTLAHEALVRAWPRMRTWIESDRADRLVRQNLEEAAAAWERDGRDPDLLYRGERLAAARRVTPEAGPLATEFLTASAHRARRTAARRNRVIAVLSALTLLAVAAAAIAVRQGLAARSERDTAVFHQLLAKADQLRATDPSVAAQLDLAAHRMRPADQEAYTRLVNDAVSTLSTALPHPNPVDEVVFSPDGRLLAGVGLDGALELWDTTDPRRPTPRTELLPGLTDGALAAGFSPDGKLFAVGDGATVRLWDVTDPSRPKAGAVLGTDHGAPVLAFSPDSRRLAVADGPRVRLFDLAVPSAPAPLGELPGHPDTISRLSFGRDGDVLVVGTPAAPAGGPTVRVWDLAGLPGATPRSTALEVPGRTTLSWFAISPDRKEVAVAAVDGVPVARGRAVRLWSLPGSRFTQRSEPTGDVSVSADGELVAVRSADGGPGVRVLPATRAGAWARTASDLALADAWTAAFGPAGRTLATVTTDQSLQLWNVRDPAAPQALGRIPTGHAGPVQHMAFIPDGNALFTSDGTSVRLWNVADPARPAPAATLVDLTRQAKEDYRLNVGEFALSADGSLFAAETGEGAHEAGVRLWDVRDPGRPRPVGTVPAPLGTVASGPPGSVTSLLLVGATLVVADGDGRLHLWDISDPARPRSRGPAAAAHSVAVTSLARDPQGKTLATAGEDHTVRLWDISDPSRPRPRGTPLTGHGGPVTSLGFSPDGRRLVTTSRDGTVLLHALHPDDLSRTVCAATWRALTPATWQQHLPGLPYDPPC